jgi:serine/threonine protein kinase
LSSRFRALKAREQDQNETANGTDFVDVLLDCCEGSAVWTVEQLAHATDKQGRDALSLANTGNRKRLWKRLLLLGRYMKRETLHQSATSIVIRVEDKEVVDGPPPPGARLLHPVRGLGLLEQVDLDDPRGKPYWVKFDSGESHHYSASSVTKMKVVASNPSMLALKRMTNDEEFQREIGFRAHWALSPEFVVAVTSVHASERVFTMPCAECSLFGAISKEHFAGIDQFAVVATARSLAKCIQHVHSFGIAHCDLKPRNFVRIGGSWKLIDFDAACVVGARAGIKYSTAYAPPELIRLLLRPMVTASELAQMINAKQLECDCETSAARRREYERQIMSMEKQLALVERIEATGIDLMERTVEAHATFDVWSFGVIMYHLLTGGQLLFRCAPSARTVSRHAQRKRTIKLAAWPDACNSNPLCLQ